MRSADAAFTDSAGYEDRGAQLFLSHASEDALAAKAFAKNLRDGGVRVWLDLDELKPGDNWMQRLEEGLESSDHFAVYIGRVGVVRWISREVRVALDRNAKDDTFKVIPILGPGANPETLPAFLKQHHWLDLRERHTNPAEVVTEIQAILGLPAKQVYSGEAPFIGLRTFDAEQAHLFFGRDQEIAELLERLPRTPFLAMVGDSGSGKSSLLRAGLLPSLQSGTHETADVTPTIWRVAIVRPGSHPFRELATALPDLCPGIETAADRLQLVKQFEGYLEKGTDGIAQCLTVLAGPGERTLLAIDQFEELFTMCADEAERERFIHSLLRAAVIDRYRPLHVVITLRADFYAECLQYANLAEALTTAQYAVRPIEGPALVELIEKPAARTGCSLESGLVEAILSDLGSSGNSLPLLEHTLLQLWKRRSSAQLTHDAYNAIGRVRGALEHHAEEFYAALAEDEKHQVRALLLKMVQPGRDSAPTGRRVELGELLPEGPERAIADAVLHKLVVERAVQINTTGTKEEYGLAHEAILKGWKRFQNWLHEDREFLFWYQRLNSAVSAFEASGRDTGALLRGAPLAEAEYWFRERKSDISKRAALFIRRSMQKASQLRWLKRGAMVTLAILTVTSILFAQTANRAQKEAEQNLQVATSAVDEMLIRVGSETLVDIPQLEDVRKALLWRARELYSRLAAQGSGDSTIKLQSGLALARVAEVDRQLGEKASAVEGLEGAIATLDELHQKHPGHAQYRYELANAYSELGRVLESLGTRKEDWSRAEGHFSTAIEMQKKLLEEEQYNWDYRLAESRSHLNRGILFKDRLAKTELAEKDLLRSIALLTETAANASEAQQEAIRQQLGRSYNTLANLLADWSKHKEAIVNYRAATDVFRQLSQNKSKRREYQDDLAQTQNNMAILLLSSGGIEGSDKLDIAIEHNREAIALFEKLAEPLPRLWLELANAHRTRGMAHMLKGQPVLAESAYQEAAKLLRSTLARAPDNPDYLFRYAVTLMDLGYSQLQITPEIPVINTRSELSQLVPRLTVEQQNTLLNLPQYRAVLALN